MNRDRETEATSLPGPVPAPWELLGVPAGDPATGLDPRPLLDEFTSDLFFPRYRPATSGGWSIRGLAMAGNRGYWGDIYRMQGTILMVGPDGEDGEAAWMSMTPAELESQEIGIRAARGHTVVCGLGMGWLAANVAVRPEVERVTVIEREPDVVALIEEAGVFDELPDDARRKLSIVQDDALSWRPDGPVDSLQADIWTRLLEDGKLADVRRMQDNIAAGSIYFWGQEMEIWRHACRRADGLAATLDWPTIRTVVEEDLRLPLALPEWVDYPDRIVAGAPWRTPEQDGWWRSGTA